MGALFLLTGSLIFLLPDLAAFRQKLVVKKEIKKFQEIKRKSNSNDSVFQKAKEYNRLIYENGQSGLVDAWSYETVPVSLKGIRGSFGYIRIPAMDVELPLYLGANEENMKKGAVILGQTSLPIGEDNSNCVIAAHRGYQGIPYFREIERLRINDQIFVTNQWETLTYRVKSMKIIKPADVDEVKIQEGKEMITLLTCHPYRTHKYRYVVCCVRDQGQTFKYPVTQSEEVHITDNPYLKPSKGDILFEKKMRRIGIGIIMVLFWLTVKGRDRLYQLSNIGKEKDK